MDEKPLSYSMFLVGQALHKTSAALVGVAPFHPDSGKLRGKRRI